MHDTAWHARISRVLSGALRLWGVSGTVSADAGDGGFVIAAAQGRSFRLHHHRSNGWTVSLVDADRPAGVQLGRHAGLPGVLRALRDELAPEAPRGRLIIGAQPLREADAR
jgi:hypothetical protein